MWPHAAHARAVLPNAETAEQLTPGTRGTLQALQCRLCKAYHSGSTSSSTKSRPICRPEALVALADTAVWALPCDPFLRMECLDESGTAQLSSRGPPQRARRRPRTCLLSNDAGAEDDDDDGAPALPEATMYSSSRAWLELMAGHDPTARRRARPSWCSAATTCSGGLVLSLPGTDVIAGMACTVLDADNEDRLASYKVLDGQEGRVSTGRCLDMVYNSATPSHPPGDHKKKPTCLPPVFRGSASPDTVHNVRQRNVPAA